MRARSISSAFALCGLWLAACGENGVAAGGVIGAEVSRAPQADDPIEFGAVPEFSLTDQFGAQVALDDLLGRPFVIGAIFTRCYGPCPRITRGMRRLQDDLAGTEVALVSISVDPEHDTPQILAAYAAENGADLERWRFLTGSEREVYQFVRGGLWMGVARGAEGEDEADLVTHSTDLVVVDRRGNRRGWYDGEDEAALDRCLKRLLFLLGEDG